MKQSLDTLNFSELFWASTSVCWRDLPDSYSICKPGGHVFSIQANQNIGNYCITSTVIDVAFERALVEGKLPYLCI